MSEMSAEKKKEIEKYIIKSYFGGGKNVESLANGADVVKGTDDGCIPDLIVEVTYFGESGVVMIKWNIYGDSLQNSFAMHVCREREIIEHNRCDSVDAMSYAWESWRACIQGKPVFMKTNDEDLQKDKRIEELERTVKTLKAEKEVMDRHIQELELENVSLGEANKCLKNSKDSYLRMVQTGATYLKDWEEATGCAKPEHVKKKISTLENECRVWHDTADHQLEQIHGLEDEVNKFYELFDGCEPAYVKQRIDEMKDEIENLNKKQAEFDPMPEYKELLEKLYSVDDVKNLEWTLNHVCGGRGSANGWMAVSLFWKQKCEALSKLVGFVTVEELQDYLTNEAKCDTLHEAILKLIDANKRVCEEWCKANSSNNSWKAAAECNSPKELMEKRAALEKEIKIYTKALHEWKEDTGCPSPSAAKTLLDHCCDENKELKSQIEEWKEKTERCTPCLAGLRLNVLRDSNTRCRNLLFGESRPENMVCIGGDKKTIRQYLRHRDFVSAVNAINELESEIDDWRKATGCLNPRYAKIKIDAYDSYICRQMEKKD